VTVGQAIWPEQLSDAETAQLSRAAPPDLDRAPDVLVVGGGMLGLATAAACTQAGLGSVVLIERERLGAGASGGAAGLLAPEAHVGTDPPALVDLARFSLQCWRALEASWPGGVGLCDVDWLGIAPLIEQFTDGLPPAAEQLAEAQVAALVSGLSSPRRGVLVRKQARVNPLQAIARLAAGLPGVATGVRALSARLRAGRIEAIETSIGELRPRHVVFATGNPPALDGVPLALAWHEVKGHMLVTEPTDLSLPGIVAPLATRLRDGRLLRGGTLDIGDAERVVRPHVVADMWAELAADWPSARDVRISHQWACFRPAHPDLLPVIDRLPGLDNAWLTSGHYKTGILMAPGTARALASWIASGERPAEVAAFGMARFAQG
jgi:glycine oxidase